MSSFLIRLAKEKEGETKVIHFLKFLEAN
jgi:hypothetical protein